LALVLFDDVFDEVWQGELLDFLLLLLEASHDILVIFCHDEYLAFV